MSKSGPEPKTKKGSKKKGKGRRRVRQKDITADEHGEILSQQTGRNPEVRNNCKVLHLPGPEFSGGGSVWDNIPGINYGGGMSG